MEPGALDLMTGTRVHTSQNRGVPHRVSSQAAQGCPSLKFLQQKVNGGNGE